MKQRSLWRRVGARGLRARARCGVGGRAGYALLGKQHRVYYSGDTGLFPAMRDSGERLGPLDITMIETGGFVARARGELAYA